MLFDIELYNQIRLWLFFILTMTINIFLFKKKIHNVFDPILYHLFWLSTSIAFAIECIFYYYNWWSLLFSILLLIYNLLLFCFSQPIKNNQSNNSIISKVKNPIILILFIFLLKFVVQDLSYWLYVIKNGIFSSTNYKFILLEQGRNFYSTIILLFISPILNYLIFYHIIFDNRKRVKLICIIIILHDIAIGGLIGHRSILFNYLLIYGFSLFYFRQNMEITSKLKKRLNSKAILYLFPAFFLVVIISGSYFSSNYGNLFEKFQKGLSVVNNRIFANGDNFYYFINFNGEDLLAPINILFYNFGVFLNPLLHDNIKNFGTLLIERAYGREVSFAQGSNFTIVFQSLNFSFLAPIYILISVFIVLKLRYIKYKNLSIKDIYFYAIAEMSLSFFVDSEYFMFRFVIFSSLFFILFLISKIVPKSISRNKE